MLIRGSRHALFIDDVSKGMPFTKASNMSPFIFGQQIATPLTEEFSKVCYVSFSAAAACSADDACGAFLCDFLVAVTKPLKPSVGRSVCPL